MAVSTSRFVATALQQTAGFCGWIWILFALIGSLGEAGSYVSRLREAGLDYLLDVGGKTDWRYLLAVSAVPALLIAVWNAKRAYRRLSSLSRSPRDRDDIRGRAFVESS